MPAFSWAQGLPCLSVQLKPPFKVEAAKSGRQYVLDCKPNEVAGGSFKPHLVIHSAETWKVPTFMNISGQGSRTAQGTTGWSAGPPAVTEIHCTWLHQVAGASLRIGTLFAR